MRLIQGLNLLFESYIIAEEVIHLLGLGFICNCIILIIFDALNFITQGHYCEHPLSVCDLTAVH